MIPIGRHDSKLTKSQLAKGKALLAANETPKPNSFFKPTSLKAKMLFKASVFRWVKTTNMKLKNGGAKLFRYIDARWTGLALYFAGVCALIYITLLSGASLLQHAIPIAEALIKAS